ncbi:hypothetical protein [Methylomonas fluvii]|uniref:Uncharacterized protein n=1 Tax=Methylomonas fluvii TaxID=1854564 RepID=A0ABR9D997_9GAMM|nr:hypothetical protein [Methylomonas fluvii]MBD9359690.1 hypothetical protein [Methylomonas fluvii]
MTLDEENKIVVMLVQALLGSVSPNFRMVSISFKNPVWKLQFVLEDDNEIDREEIEDIITDFDVFLMDIYPEAKAGAVKFEAETTISKEDNLQIEPGTRKVYRRREDYT